MAVTSAVVNGTLPQANSGTVDLESAGFGTPSAALIFLNIANTTNNPQAGMQYCIGYWDGTTVQSTANFSTDAVGTTSTGRLSDINELRYGTSAGPLVYTVANATNGITITKTSGSTGVDRYVTAILFAGLTNAYVGYKSLGTGTSAVDITDPGFKPDAVFMSCIGSNSADTSTTHAIHSFGIAHNNSSDVVTQGYVSVSSENALGSGADTDSRTSHSDSATQTFNGTTSWEATASAFDASGFSLTPTASAGSDYVLYLAIECPDPDDFHVDVIDAAISTGNDAKTGFGFQPIVAGVVSANNTALDSITGGYQFNFGASDGTSSATHWIHDEDAVGTTNVNSEYSSSEFLHLTDDAGTDDAIATLSSFDSDGLTLNYSDAAAGASKLLIWAIGDSTAVGGVTPIPPRLHNLDNQHATIIAHRLGGVLQ